MSFALQCRCGEPLTVGSEESSAGRRHANIRALSARIPLGATANASGFQASNMECFLLLACHVLGQTKWNRFPSSSSCEPFQLGTRPIHEMYHICQGIIATPLPLLHERHDSKFPAEISTSRDKSQWSGPGWELGRLARSPLSYSFQHPLCRKSIFHVVIRRVWVVDPVGLRLDALAVYA